ncbi:MAG: hypothetical protein ACRDOU_27775 [Streptosporangiaceae bacterium]
MPYATTWSRRSGVSSPVRVQGDHRTEPDVVPLDPVELICKDFSRRDLAPSDRRGDLMGLL